MRPPWSMTLLFPPGLTLRMPRQFAGRNTALQRTAGGIRGNLRNILLVLPIGPGRTVANAQPRLIRKLTIFDPSVSRFPPSNILGALFPPRAPVGRFYHAMPISISTNQSQEVVLTFRPIWRPARNLRRPRLSWAAVLSLA